MYLGSLARTAPIEDLTINSTVELITTGAISAGADQEL
jgi:hypothetical protein